ncbi:hypothetical protein QQ045_001120 [Rhodiola kirilowii]
MANFRHRFGYPAIPESILFDANSVLLHALLTIVSLSTFLHGLTENTIVLDHKVPPIVLCALLASVDLGLEHNIASGATSETHLINFKDGTISCLSLSTSMVLFLLGLHETMMHWSNLIVKPVVDDMVFMSLKEGNKVVEKAVMTVSCGAMWWWMLRDEVASMVVAAVVVDGGVSDLIFWWLYFATLFIGMVKIVKCLFWVGSVLASCKGESMITLKNL